MIAIENLAFAYPTGGFALDIPSLEVGAGTSAALERRDVELGLSDGINVEVISGLKEDQAIKKPK